MENLRQLGHEVPLGWRLVAIPIQAQPLTSHPTKPTLTCTNDYEEQRGKNKDQIKSKQRFETWKTLLPHRSCQGKTKRA